MPDKQLFTFRTPVGVAAIVTAGNFPVAVPSWYLVPALLCGNAVVWKPAEYTPATAEAFAQLFLHAGFPEGVFNLVLADGAADVRGARARARRRASSTRSASPGPPTSADGSASSAGATCRSPCLELGGKNPLVVMPDADLDLAVEGALFSGFGTAGQRCTSLGTVIVHARRARRLRRPVRRRRCARRRSATRPQDVLYGPMISARFCERFEGWLELIRPHHTRTARPATGRITPSNPREGFVGDSRGRAVLPPDDRRRRHGATTTCTAPRRSGRSWAWRRSTTFDEAMALANGHGYGLSSVDLHDRSAARVPVPRARLGRHGEREQLDERRRGPPAVRRQRQERQRQPAIGHVGPRPVHALAGDELGLLGRLQKAQMDVADVLGRPAFRLPD